MIRRDVASSFGNLALKDIALKYFQGASPALHSVSYSLSLLVLASNGAIMPILWADTITGRPLKKEATTKLVMAGTFISNGRERPHRFLSLGQ